MVNKHYPVQFKADAVALYRSRPGATIAQIADDVGVNPETLRSWVRADDQQRGAGASGGSARQAQTPPASVEDENAELRRRVRDLEEERDILRKAARYFTPARRSEPGPTVPTSAAGRHHAAARNWTGRCAPRRNPSMGVWWGCRSGPRWLSSFAAVDAPGAHRNSGATFPACLAGTSSIRPATAPSHEPRRTRQPTCERSRRGYLFHEHLEGL
jgi:transposase